MDYRGLPIGDPSAEETFDLNNGSIVLDASVADVLNIVGNGQIASFGQTESTINGDLVCQQDLTVLGSVSLGSLAMNDVDRANAGELTVGTLQATSVRIGKSDLFVDIDNDGDEFYVEKDGMKRHRVTTDACYSVCPDGTTFAAVENGEFYISQSGPKRIRVSASGTTLISPDGTNAATLDNGYLRTYAYQGFGLDTAGGSVLELGAWGFADSVGIAQASKNTEIRGTLSVVEQLTLNSGGVQSQALPIVRSVANGVLTGDGSGGSSWATSVTLSDANCNNIRVNPAGGIDTQVPGALYLGHDGSNANLATSLQVYPPMTINSGTANTLALPTTRPTAIGHLLKYTSTGVVGWAEPSSTPFFFGGQVSGAVADKWLLAVGASTTAAETASSHRTKCIVPRATVTRTAEYITQSGIGTTRLTIRKNGVNVDQFFCAGGIGVATLAATQLAQGDILEVLYDDPGAGATLPGESRVRISCW